MKIMLIYIIMYLLINHNCFQKKKNESQVIYHRNKHGFMHPLENFPCLPSFVGKQHNVSV